MDDSMFSTQDQKVIDALNSSGAESPDEKAIFDKLFETRNAREIIRIWGVDTMQDDVILTGRNIIDSMISKGIVYLRRPIPGKVSKLRKGQKRMPPPVNQTESEERTIKRLQRTIERWFKHGELEPIGKQPYKTTVRKLKIFLVKKQLGLKPNKTASKIETLTESQSVKFNTAKNHHQDQTPDLNKESPAASSFESRPKTIPQKRSRQKVQVASGQMDLNV